jgi:hypothetical protein
MTNTKGTLSMKYINTHAGIIIRVSSRATDPEANRSKMITALIGVNDTDRARIRTRIEQMLADA